MKDLVAIREEIDLLKANILTIRRDAVWEVSKGNSLKSYVDTVSFLKRDEDLAEVSRLLNEASLILNKVRRRNESAY